MNNKKNKVVVLVTGATTPEGKAVARGLARTGCSVVTAAHLSSTADEPRRHACEKGMAALLKDLAKTGGNAVSCVADLSTDQGARQAIDTATDTLGALDLLVTCSAVEGERALLRLEGESWRRLHDAHLTATFLCCQATARWMIEQERRGQIICLTGVEGLRARNFGATHLASVSGGVVGLVRSLALELRHKQISVNAVALEARRRTPDTEADPDIAEDRREIATLVPLIGFLATRAGAEISGQVICLDGKRISLLRTLETVGALSSDEGWSADAIARRWSELSR